MPSQLGGLPEGTPERSTIQPIYPAVHDVPPKRGKAVLTEEERRDLEAELSAARDRAARRAVDAEPNAR